MDGGSGMPEIPSFELSRRQVVGTMAVSAVGLAGLPVQAAHVDEEGDRHGARITGLAVDGREDGPLGVDDPAPRLSWRVVGAGAGEWTQSAYQIRAARTEKDLDRGRLLWDSGKV